MRFPTSLRLTSYIALKPQRGAQKRKMAVFQLKSHFAWRKSATKFLYVKSVSDKVVTHSLTYLSTRKWLVGTSPSTWNLADTDPHPCKTPIFNLLSLVAITLTLTLTLT